jgi:hypothetical protein
MKTNENGEMVDENGERLFKISQEALVLTLVNHIVTYIGDDTPESEKKMMQQISGELAMSLYETHKNGNASKDHILIIFLNFASKIMDLHELETKSASTLMEQGSSYGAEAMASIQKVIGMNIHDFVNLEQEPQFQFLLKFILDMKIDVIKTYQELDMLEADVTNKPVFSH